MLKFYNTVKSITSDLTGKYLCGRLEALKADMTMVNVLSEGCHGSCGDVLRVEHTQNIVIKEVYIYTSLSKLRLITLKNIFVLGSSNLLDPTL